jgi:hypothetical protein
MNILITIYVKLKNSTQLVVTAQNKYDLNDTQREHKNLKATKFKS